MTITPDQARELLDGATPGPWELRDTDALMGGRAFHLRQSGKPGIRASVTTYGHNDDPELLAAAPDLAQTIAAQKWEYGVEYLGRVTHWGSREFAENDLEEYLEVGVFLARLVRRLVGPAEVIDGE